MTKRELESIYGKVATVYELNALCEGERRLAKLHANRLVAEFLTLSDEVRDVRAALDEKLDALEALEGPVATEPRAESKP